MEISQLQKRAQNLKPSKVRRDLFEFIKTIEEVFKAYNKNNLFYFSEDVEGNPIGYYSAGTEVITNGLKKQGDPFDLKDSGDFLNSLFATVQDHSILFGATDPKKKEVLSNLLSEDIFGIKDEDLNRIIETRLTPFLIEYYLTNLLS